MNEWNDALVHSPAVLVTVALVQGSGPREAGAKMLVGRARAVDTIGGGHLELRALEIARAMLADGRARHVERFALGPGLGQCCGGVVHLAFERVDAELAAALKQRRGEDSWRITSVDGTSVWAVFDASGAPLAGAGEATPPFTREGGTRLMQDASGRHWLIDPIRTPRAHLMLFGAGHVGAAIVRALAELPCTVTWVDEREDMFPATVPANVTVAVNELPEALVGAAPSGASYLVMTHSHTQDGRLTEAIMARLDVGWFGLIGSLTKRRQFEHRLRAKGVTAQQLATMVCPIGLPGIVDKAPAVIAASVCAQLLGVWEQQHARRAALPMRLTAGTGR